MKKFEEKNLAAMTVDFVLNRNGTAKDENGYEYWMEDGDIMTRWEKDDYHAEAMGKKDFNAYQEYLDSLKNAGVDAFEYTEQQKEQLRQRRKIDQRRFLEKRFKKRKQYDTSCNINADYQC